MKKLTFLCMLLFPLFGWGQSKLSPYTRQVLDIVAQDAPLKSLSAPQRQIRQVADTNKQVNVFIHLNDEDAITELEEAGIQTGTIAGKLVTAHIQLNQLEKLSGLAGVGYIEIGTPVNPQMDEVRKATRTDRVQQGTDLPHPFKGKDVVIGIVDNGFEYGHLNFWNEDKSQLRIKRVWDQNGSGNAPALYSYGSEYSTQEEILAAEHDAISSTHGTHVTGIATGSARSNETNYSGIAPEADIVLVSLNTTNMLQGNNAAVIDGINYIYQYAESVGKPCVVNLSLGSHMGPHDGTSTFDLMADQLQGPGKLLVGAVGNEATNKFHAYKQFSGEQPDTLKTFIDFKYMYDEFSSLEIWGDKGLQCNFIPFIYDIHANRVVATYPPATLSESGSIDKEYSFSEQTDFLIGKLKVNGEINPNNQKEHFAVTASFFRSDTHRVGFFLTSSNPGAIHIWTEVNYSGLSSFGVDGFVDGNDDCSMGELGGTGKRIISVGGYVSRDHYYRYGIYYPSGEKLDSLVSFSSHGPTADGRLKPEITAPGSYIVSSLSSFYEGNKIKAETYTSNGKKYEFGYMQGTSMSSPAVAGILATWLQANPQLTPEQAKEIFQETAHTDAFTGNLAGDGNNLWGYGKVDAWEGLQTCIRQTSIDETQTTDKMPVVYTIGSEARITFLEQTPSCQLMVYQLNGMPVCQTTEYNIAPADTRVISLPQLPKGVYLLQATYNQNCITQKITIQ